MSLSVCVAPGLTVTAVAERLRPLDVELIRVEWTQDPEAARLQCTRDWILWLDHDELPSHELVERLPELLSRRDIPRFCVARSWLFPDAEHRLTDVPWNPDFPDALTRREAPPRHPGLLHAHTVTPRPFAYVVEPLLCSALLHQDEAERRDQVVVGEAIWPGLEAQGGGRLGEAFLLPEVHRTARVAPLGSTDRVMPVSARPGSVRREFLELENPGPETWPHELDADPPVRLGHRWVPGDGGEPVDGPRSPLPHAVRPGESLLAAVDAVVPARPGKWTLEIDVVHEHVAWLDRGISLPLAVEDAETTPPFGPRLARTHAPRPRSRRRVRIPRVIHRVWLGNAPIPAQDVRWGETFGEQNPAWDMRLWTDADLDDLGFAAEDVARARSPAELSNLVRYEILLRHGGVYVDTDVECLRPLEPLVRGVDGFAGLEAPGRVCNAILGSVPGHTVFERAIRCGRRTLGLGPNNPTANGPYMLSLILEQEPGLAILGSEVMYPFRWDEPTPPRERFSDAYMVHYWNLSWAAAENVVVSPS